jgi:hypothetical protein
MKTAYSFVVLRYVHDIMTGEFINIGVALYAPAAKYLGGFCNSRFGRLSKMFGDIDGEYFRGLMRYIEAQFEKLGDEMRNGLPLFKQPADIMEIAKRILPPDDSSLQWSEPGGGQTENPARTLEELYMRMVERYENKTQRSSREDEDVWRTFKKELEAKHVLSQLRPKQIVAPDFDYEFKHAWKNQQWHVYEPVSFDLMDAGNILDKANRWLGRAMALRESSDKFKLCMLLGEPSLENLRSTFTKAQNILNKMPGDKEFIREREAKQFSEVLAAEITAHDGHAEK